MSENAIKHDELIEPGVFDRFKKNGAEALALTKELTVAFSQMAKASGKEIQGIKLESVQNVKKFNEEIRRVDEIEKAYNHTQKESIALKKQLSDREDDVVKGKIRLSQANQEQNRILKNQVILEKAATGSIEQLRAKLSLITGQYNKLSAAERDNTVAGKSLLADQKALTNQLNKLEQAGGNFRRNVGNYPIHFDKIGKSVKGLTGLLGELGSALGLNTEVMERFIGLGETLHKVAEGFEKFEKIKDVGKIEDTAETTADTAAKEANAVATLEQAAAEEALKAAKGEQAAATETATVAQEEFNAAAEANPIGIIILAIIALAAALYGLNAYLTSSSDETKRLESENNRLIKAYEKQQVITKARTTVLQSELDLLKAQGAPLEEIRKKQQEINEAKEAELKLNIESIRSSIALNKQKIADVAANDSVWESIMKAAEATQRFLGNEKQADLTLAVIAQNKQERAEEFTKTLEEQENALIQAEADYEAFLNDIKVQDIEFDKEQEDRNKEELDKLKKHNEHRAQLYREDRDAKIAAEEEKYQYLIGLRKRLESLEADVTPLTDRQQETKRYMDQLAELDDIKERAQEQGRFNEERYNKDIELINAKHMANMEAIHDDEIDQEIDAEKKKQEEITRINKEAEEARKLALKKSIDEQIAIEQKLIDSYREGIQQRRSDEDMYMRYRENQITSDLQEQQKLFVEGEENTLGFQKKKREEFYQEQRRLAQQRHNEEQALKLAELYIELQKTYADEGIQGALKAYAQTMAAKGIAMAISGSYEEGTEDTGRAGSAGMDGKGGRLFLLHDNERVVPKYLNEKLKGMTNDELVDNALAFEAYRAEMVGANLPRSTEETYAQKTTEMLLLNGLMGLTKTVKNKKEYSLYYNDLKQLIEDTYENGQRRQVILSRPRA